ncbi:hypothetical protein C2S52_007531 [Perilla frutescens var. hirtella]|nr:hypothetical protein C2S52_007531 [Perilla frutescens var. hirtella]
MMMRFTSQTNLHRRTVTRFATSFITLAQYHKLKNNLRKMVTSEECNSSKWRKDVGEKKIATYILKDTFWCNILYALKLVGPLVKVLRMIDGEMKPTMGYIYEAMDIAKEAIAKSFFMNEEHYKEAFEFIDKFYYANPKQVSCAEVEKGLYDCNQRLTPDLETQDKIMVGLDAYKNASDLFDNVMAIKHMNVKSPNWWSCYGSSSPNLKSFAIKLLSLSCSATGCERNCGVFQHRKDTIDPILLDEIDESNECFIGKMDRDNSNEEEDDLVLEGLRDEDVLEDIGVEMEMEKNIGEDKDDKRDENDEFYDDY